MVCRRRSFGVAASPRRGSWSHHDSLGRGVSESVHGGVGPTFSEDMLPMMTVASTESWSHHDGLDSGVSESWSHHDCLDSGVSESWSHHDGLGRGVSEFWSRGVAIVLKHAASHCVSAYPPAARDTRHVTRHIRPVAQCHRISVAEGNLRTSEAEGRAS